MKLRKPIHYAKRTNAVFISALSSFVSSLIGSLWVEYLSLTVAVVADSVNILCLLETYWYKLRSGDEK
jgi:hypothetical protein